VARRGTLLLTRSDINGLMSFDEYLRVVENAFRLYAEGKSLKPVLMHVDSGAGEFHIKAGGLLLDKTFFGLKVNGGFFQNMRRFGMPNIQGTILLSDGENGYPLAIMDSREITAMRTGAATAVAAKYLARPESNTLTICGSGTQGRMQLRGLAHIFRFKHAFVFGRNRANAELFASEMHEELEIAITAAEDLKEAVATSDVCVTCTPSREYFLLKEYISPGTFIAAVGADSPVKHELEPSLLRSSKVVVDILAQCAEVGELHHALEAGMMESDVYAELGEIVAGKKRGRITKEEIIIFDSTGTALQDVAASAAVYEKAVQLGKGQVLDFFQ
jgi:alanine dehydrogenase